MKLPSPLLESRYFQFNSANELKACLGDSLSTSELQEFDRLDSIGLPPITSPLVIAAMFGVNPGVIWSMYRRSGRYYRTFGIPKGNGIRQITAPKVSLKIIQKWLAEQLQKIYIAPRHVYGFLPGLSHVDAARVHCEADWVFSVDIENFFPSTPLSVVSTSLQDVGFSSESSYLIAKLCCFGDRLSQGAPSSPILSNICFSRLDSKLEKLQMHFGIRLTRYADDIVFSGQGAFPEGLEEQFFALFNNQPWKLSEHKTSFSALPHRLKVHGLLVHGTTVRLTKGYRNKLRAYEHLLALGKIKEEDLSRIKGHISYSRFISRTAALDKDSQ